MTEQQKHLLIPGNYNMKKLLLITENNVIDLKQVFVQLNIYEDLFSFTFSGNMSVVESDNFTGKEKILGGERLIIEFESMTEVEGELILVNTNLTAIITKISSEAAVTSGMSKTYVIDFVSIDHISNMRKKISKSFFKTPFHEIVRFCVNALDSDSNLKLEPSKNIIDRIIIPFWTPFRAISWCADKAIQTQSRKTNSLSSFLFYQTIYNTEDARNVDVSSYFHFVSIDSLLKKPPKNTVVYNVKNTDPYKKSTKKFVDAESFSVVESFDYLKMGMQGAYTSVMTEVSFMNKKWRYRVFNYKKDYDLMDHIYENPYMNELNDLVNFSKNAQVAYMKSMDENKYNFAKNIRTNQLSFLNNRKIRLLLPGNSFFSVGDIINFKYPSFEKDYTKDSTGEDPTFSGKYLITSINHTLTAFTYKVAVEAVLESLP